MTDRRGAPRERVRQRRAERPAASLPDERPPIEELRPARHAVYRIADGLLLVFKPRGHREAEHAHEHRQRLRVLFGRLEVRTARRRVTLEGGGAPFTLEPRRRHATEALDDTWIVAEALSSPERTRR